VAFVWRIGGVDRSSGTAAPLRYRSISRGSVRTGRVGRNRAPRGSHLACLESRCRGHLLLGHTAEFFRAHPQERDITARGRPAIRIRVGD
jgi:hypothetical protein